MSKRTRVVLIVALAALLAVPVVAVAADRFTDVPTTNVFHDDIGWLADAGVTLGCNPPANDEFCPEDPVKRQQMAAFMRRFAAYLGAEDGVVSEADHAATADSATTAGSAATAGSATTAGDADTLDGIDSTSLLADGTPPEGTTARGDYAVGNDASWAWTNFNWGFILASAPVPHFLVQGAAPTAECPGTPTQPEAAPGHLCVYEAQVGNATGQVVFATSQGTGDTADPFGAGVFVNNASTGDFWSYGTWAVTVGVATTSSGATDGGGPLPGR